LKYHREAVGLNGYARPFGSEADRLGLA